METTNQRKYFKGLRALALTALFCTIALTLFIWGEALTPGDKSAIQSAKVSDNIQSAMKTDEPAPLFPPLQAMLSKASGVTAKS